MNLPYWEEKMESCIIIVNTGDAKSFVSMEKLWKQGYLICNYWVVTTKCDGIVWCMFKALLELDHVEIKGRSSAPLCSKAKLNHLKIWF